MRRRALLTSAIAGLTGLAGCLGTSESAHPTASPTPSPSPTPTPGPTGQAFTVRNVACGQGANRATVSLDEVVTVDGTIDGSNGCHRARLAAVEYDRSADELTVAVEAYEPDDAEMCTMCIVDIEYEATVRFDGPMPETVVVTHDGEVVTRS